MTLTLGQTGQLTQLLAAVVETQERQIAFPGLPGGWMRLLALTFLGGLCYAVLWLYRREARTGASSRVRRTLAVIRCVVLLILAVIWIQPVLATHILRTHTSWVAVLADVSASMTIQDSADESRPIVVSDGRTEPAGPGPATSNPVSGPSAATRLQKVDALLSGGDYEWLRRLAERNEPAVFAFGQDSSRLPLPRSVAAIAGASQAQNPSQQSANGAVADSSPSGPTLLANRPIQQVTDLGQALAAVSDNLGNDPIAGIVLITDGAVNGGMSEEEVLAYLRRTNIPVYAIGVGQTTEPPNVRIASISAPATVAKGDPFEIRVEVAAEGIEPTEMQVELLAEKLEADGSAAGQGGDARTTVVATRPVRLGGDVQPPPLLFQITPQAAGEFVYRARLGVPDGGAESPHEAVKTDNVRETNVVVLDDRLRVLIVSGGPTYDYRFVTRLLERDKSIDVSCWLQSADPQAIRDGDIVVKELPRQPEQIFQYDAVLLMDPSPGDLDSSWAVTLRRFVDEFGGGVLYQAGHKYATRFLREPSMQDLVSILPIVPDPEVALRMHEQGSYVTRDWPILIPEENRAHPLLALADDPETGARIWSSLSGVWSYVPVLREKPVATVLMRNSNPTARNQYGPAVLMAVQPVGGGRTGFLAFDTTSRWRSIGEPQFNRFWVQIVRYLGQMRRQSGNKRGTITIDRERITIGEPFKIEVRVLDELFNPWHEPQITAVIETQNSTEPPITTELRAIPGRDGWYTGRVAIAGEGLSVIRVALPTTAGATESLTRRLRVQRPDIEMRGLRQRAELLKRMADETMGRYCTLAEAGQVPEWIEKATRVTASDGPVVDLWDRWWVLAVLATLLSVEWAVRRRNHLL